MSSWNVRRALSLAFFTATLGFGAFSTIPAPAGHAPIAALASNSSANSSEETFRAGPLQSILHSHNDYEQDLPLQKALDQGFASVEADVWLRRGDFKISHMGFFFKGSLRRMYLEPLQRLVDERGSVHGDGKPFYLWIDIKSDRGPVVEALQTLLSEFPCLSRFSDDHVDQRAVTVILTGDEKSKINYVNSYPVRYATRDSTSFLPGDPRGDLRWSWYSLPWQKYFQWNGKGQMPADQRARLKTMVERIHAQGRRLRFWDAPHTDEFWGAIMDARVDAIGTDKLGALCLFIKTRLLPKISTPQF